jgi:hypothetical protein
MNYYIELVQVPFGNDFIIFIHLIILLSPSTFHFLFFPIHHSVKPDIKRFEANAVIFNDGTRVECDAVIFSTGYNISFPFLRPSLQPRPAAEIKVERGSYYTHLHAILYSTYFIMI